MTEFRDKKRDIKVTAEQIKNKANVSPKEKSWLDHTKGSAVLDYELLQGATIEKMIASSGRQQESVIGHIKHLETEHGLIVSEKDGIHTLVAETSTLFSNVQQEHIAKAIEVYEAKGVPDGLSSSKFYDVKINNTLYPPKPIMAYANYYASDIEPHNYFSGGANTRCFKAFERLGIEIISKGNSLDVTDEFAIWLQSNTFDSYRNYIGATTNDTILKLKEIDQFFPEIELFKIKESKIKQHSNKILSLLKKKERVKNEAFVEYDLKNSNGIPKAIIGKNNYLKFLKDKFIKNQTNYWIFQGNPEVYDIVNALKAAHLKSWKVAAHKDKIKKGDKVIIWQTGKNAGCYALAEVTSDVSIFEEEKYEKQYYTDKSNSAATERVKIEVTHYFVSNPILWNAVKDNPLFSDFKAGNQGTNFYATQQEYETLIALKETKTEKQYWLYAPGEQARKWEEFYEEGVFGLGWDELGDLRQYKNRDEIKDALVDAYGGEGSKKNDVIANDEFLNKIKIGDIVFVKKGRKELLGYGRVTSEYIHDKHRLEYKNIRKVEWLLKGSWKTDFSLVLKTLTDITKYDTEVPNYNTYYERLFGIFESNINSMEKQMLTNTPINQILYGPPGTGKTYYLKNQLFDKYTTKQTSISSEQYFESVVANCSWWQVIAIALLDIGRSKVSDVFNHKWVQKKASLSNSKTIRPTLWGQLQSHTINECAFVNVSSRQQPLLFNKTKESFWEIVEEEVRELAPELYELRDSVKNYLPNPDVEIKNYRFVTFHQSFAYEDFIEGIKPVFSDQDQGDLGYQIEDGVFKEICNKAKNDPDNKYAIFIDEINRGNVSAIFGELITLIEKDKRLGAKNEISIELPYSKTSFGVPSNLDIYGTMNTADRSVEALDTALRRRFSFVEMMPNTQILEGESIDDISLSEVLKTINLRIEALLDRDHTIGHSYLLGVASKKDLANTFNNNIIPLLQEYFYGDYGKIGLVLGEGFVKSVEVNDSVFSSFEYEGSDGLLTSSYELIPFDEIDFENAMEQLLK